MKDKINQLYGKDDKVSYKTLLDLELESSTTNELYKYFEDFLGMLKSNKPFVRVRGFRLICSLAKWDSDNKISSNIDTILDELNDEVSVSVRQCLSKINLILIYKPELTEVIENKINSLDLSIYKESMQSLIKRDIDKIIKQYM